MSKWLGRLALGLLFALVILWLVPRVSGAAMEPSMAPPPSMAGPEIPAVVMAPPPSMPNVELSIADMAMAAAPAPAAAPEIVLMNPSVPAPPPVTSSTPLPPIPDFRPVIQQPPVIPRMDPTMTDMGIQSVLKQKATLPQPPAIIATPNMTQGLEPVSMNSIVGMDI